jgi:hypothetical protein
MLWTAGVVTFGVCLVDARREERGPIRLFVNCYLIHFLCVTVILLTLHLHVFPRRVGFFVDAAMLGGILVALVISLIAAAELARLKVIALLSSSITLAAFVLLIAHPRRVF